jgi:spore coat polysaccharide biosynthesis predicted glycosyltransferase SpsG
LHPSESGLLHNEIIKNLNIKAVIIKDYDILEIIKSCDLLISQKSTTLLEAMIIGTPMILLDFVNKDFDETSEYEFLNDKYIISVKNQNKLTLEIKELIANRVKIKDYRENLCQFVRKFSFYDEHEPPTIKTYNFIKSILNSY